MPGSARRGRQAAAWNIGTGKYQYRTGIQEIALKFARTTVYGHGSPGESIDLGYVLRHRIPLLKLPTLPAENTPLIIDG
ncbi:hypothetical protein [Azohydromonas lata]|uniref:Uncharacterized protein n=1 Tax=Azohydromonas lata TaxID=45677 RepID=A0ABU5ICA8_9BURK|nr:hypothetical protein [Azohydromonas lata]MDZ5456577.1 hypothetical protein [Azohydromonas lata]